MLPEPGARFDRYRIEAKLGEGGMGRVYRAFDERLQRRVALKILHPAPDGSANDSHASQGAAQLLREARAAAALDHPNAIAIFDVGTAMDGEAALPFIAMELIEGRSLRSFIGELEPSVGDRLRWLLDVARAVAAAHRRGLVHRDIKPENVMIRDEDGVVKVLDFGIARRAKVDATAATSPGLSGTLTGAGVVVGTPLYMAPEQMRGEAVDGHADQFSWAVLAYELLSGRLPWDRNAESFVVISQILTRDAPPLRAIAPAVPPHVEAAIMRALAKNPADRFASMDEIVQVLDPQVSRPPPPRGLPRAAIESLGSAATVQSTKTSLVGALASQAPTLSAAPAGRRRLIVPALMALAVALAGVAGLARRGRQPATAPDAAAPTATTLLDLRVPSTTADALAAYKSGMYELRRGDPPLTAAAFTRAIELDPLLAPALLRLARQLLFDQPTAARELFRRASQARSSLSPRDDQLLEAYEPLFQQEPADSREARKRLEALTARYPFDAELFFELGRLNEQVYALDSALGQYSRAIELDPGYGYALIGKADIYFERGDTAGAIAVTRECDRVAPGVTNCQTLRTMVDDQEGRCEDLADEARRAILVHPNGWQGYLLTADSLAAAGSPLATVREALAQTRARMTDAENALPENQLLEADAFIRGGAFADARTAVLARESDPSVKESAQELEHAIVAWAHIQLDIEVGRNAEAVDIAADFLARSRVWSLPPEPDSWIWRDAKLPMLALLVREKRIPQEELESARAAIAKSMSDPRDPVFWVGAHAWPVATPTEARLALDALARFEPLRSIWEFPAEFAIGRTYLLAGFPDQALPHLTRAANACDALENPFDHVRASLLLGQALEAKNDISGACTAYQRVVRQWGDAKPRSVTASAARARISALKCAPPDAQ